MNIHEYQGKEILRKYNVPVPRGIPAFSVDEAIKAAETLGGPVWVVKAQIHAGGRGKGGGVKVAKSMDQVKEYANGILGMTLVTHQTGPTGKVVKRIYIEAGCDIKRELYLGMLVDRATSRITIMASEEGGMEIEEVAATHPEKILHEPFDADFGLLPYQARKVGFALGFNDAELKSAAKFLPKICKFFVDNDCSMVEINPLVVTSGGDVLALDAAEVTRLEADGAFGAR